ncbi:hypothetical protein NSE01_35100 [Novosphingobium sediminis]|uniref:Lipoprotein n=1 Tax=Novosphingobium sediminis TaxID=707214 RepID=A0A512APP5_9SPHN|nr:hypothetical protein [Novosphingobium sediminis]GEO01678.1 hypothetical protein NSE01_35100 [Novosphingobium sediminis]
MLFLLLAAAASSLNACESAVRTDLPSAAIACRVPFGTLRQGADAADASSYDPIDDLTPTCREAMRAGQVAGWFGPAMPIAIRRGYVRQFEEKLAICRKSLAASP